jgi:hypothetical protein
MATTYDDYSAISISFLDHSNEVSNVNLYIPPVTAANFDASETAAALLVGAIRAVTLCNPISRSIMVPAAHFNLGVPTSNWAQRELGLQIGMVDNVNGRKSHFTIPGVDWNSLAGDGDFVNYTNLLWIALKEAVEAEVKSYNGNSVTVVYGKLIGRRS